MDTETLKALHQDIEKVRRLCPLAIRKAQLKKLKQEERKIEVKIAKHGANTLLLEAQEKIRIKVKLARLFVSGVNMGAAP